MLANLSGREVCSSSNQSGLVYFAHLVLCRNYLLAKCEFGKLPPSLSPALLECQCRKYLAIPIASCHKIGSQDWAAFLNRFRKT